jgi:hypothetical protein
MASLSAARASTGLSNLVVMEAHVHGVSTREVDNLVKALGGAFGSKSGGQPGSVPMSIPGWLSSRQRCCP